MIVHKVVHDHELERHTREGWKLEQLIVASRYDKVSCETPINCTSQYNYAGYVTVSRETAIQVNEVKYLLSKDDAVISLEEQCRKEVATLNEKMAALRLKSSNDDRDLKDLREAEKACQARIGELTHSFVEQRTKASKLEEDLAKIRAAIGTKAYADALK